MYDFFPVGVVVALILDYNNPTLAKFGGGTRFMIFMLETANTRFGGTDNSTLEDRPMPLYLGYATTDLSLLASGTLLVFVLLMGVKPQMVGFFSSRRKAFAPIRLVVCHR